MQEFRLAARALGQHTQSSEAVALGVPLQEAGAAEEEEPGSDSSLWQSILAAQTNSDVVSVNVTGVNKGGVIVNYNGLNGFIPYSLLDATRLSNRVANPEKELAHLIGTSIEAVFVKVRLFNPVAQAGRRVGL
jgi:ribosomal protein S1